jgi:small multidrug resistance family-3 protein
VGSIAYIGAALAEIAGCFSFWARLRPDRSPWWLVPGTASLMLFAWLLTLVEAWQPPARLVGTESLS